MGIFVLSVVGAGLGGGSASFSYSSLGSSSQQIGMVGPVPFGATSQVALKATASGSPLTGPAPLVVSFKGSASGGTSPYTYSWNYGGTTTSTSQNPSHTFLYTGSFHVTLKVTDSKKAVSSTSVSVTVATTVGGVSGSLVAAGVSVTTPSTFFSLNAVTNCNGCISTDSGITSYLSSTPFKWIRYGVDSDRCNASADKSYSDSGTSSSGCGFSLSDFKKWCNGQTPVCHAILTLPGENNNSHEDAAIAQYIVKTIGFQPDYWAIGNEPTGWTHYGIAWTKWRTSDSSKPTPLAYAFDVKAAITAVTAVDSAAKFIGLEAACDCNTEWFQDVAKVDGSKISAIAYHSYPSTGLTTETVPQLFALLSGSKNLSSSLATVRAAISSECTSCPKMPIFVNEYNAGPGWTPSSLAGTYANALFLAASTVQALHANVSQLSIYSLQTTSKGSYGYAMMDSADSIGPSGILYSKLLDHLTIGKVLATGVKTSVGGVWAVLTQSGTTESLMVVNTNLTASLALSLGSALPLGTSGHIYQWNPNLSSPTDTSGFAAAAYSIPPEGILLITV